MTQFFEMVKLISSSRPILGSGSEQGNREDPGGLEVSSSREFSSKWEAEKCDALEKSRVHVTLEEHAQVRGSECARKTCVCFLVIRATWRRYFT